MKDFQDLIIEGKSNIIIELFEFVTKNLQTGWRRDAETEKRTKEHSPLDNENYFCFYVDTKFLSKATLFFHLSLDKDICELTNIIPKNKSEMSYDEYNDILNSFYNLYLKPNSDQFGIHVKMTPPDLRLENLISQESFEKLKRFSRAANKSTGSSHPLDRKRWYDFIIYYYQNDLHKIESDFILRWLIEEESWPEKRAFDLIIEFEFGIGLLEYNENEIDQN